jgi:hypothetical protein
MAAMLVEEEVAPYFFMIVFDTLIGATSSL